MRTAAVVLVALLPAACAKAPIHARHLVVVTIDTLRADRVGAYGHSGAATPHLDGLARDGAMALDASAHVPLTRPSHVSLFTGRLPTETGIRDNVSPSLSPAIPLLAEILRRHGFATGAFVSSVVLDSSSGLNRGFEVYSDKFEGDGGDARFLNRVQKRGDRTTAEAIKWLEAEQRRLGEKSRLFLWLHLYDPHDPYEPPEPYASRFAERLYDGEVAFADALVGRLDDAMGRLGLSEHTTLVVTSDHGEGLGDHDETQHGFFAYQTTLAVPFFVRGPRVVAGTRLTAPVGLVDVLPTALDLLGLPPAPDVGPGGESLAPLLGGRGHIEDRPLYAESLVPLLHFGWSDLRVVRQGRLKYIQAPRPELYDLAEDPGETRNLAAGDPRRAAALRAVLEGFLKAERMAAAAGSATVPAELLEKLGALGYVGAAGGGSSATPGADPKDRVQEFRIAHGLMRQGLLRLQDEDYAASVARFREVLALGIESFEVHFYLGRCLRQLGDTARAARHFQEAARRAPAHVAAWDELAESLRVLGRKADARAALEKAVRVSPRDADLHMRLGELLRDIGEVEQAILRQRQAVQLAPTVGSYWNSLGMTLGGSGRKAEAERAFREANRLDGADHSHAYNLGLILQRQGRTEEARMWFEKALSLEPSFEPARERLAETAQ